MKNKIRKYFEICKGVAISGDCKEAQRRYRLGAVGIRTDGAIVVASNISTRTPSPPAHAEARLTKKLNNRSIVYVVRINKSKHLANARPCKNCITTMRLRGISRCYYSISENEYGVIKF